MDGIGTLSEAAATTNVDLGKMSKITAALDDAVGIRPIRGVGETYQNYVEGKAGLLADLTDYGTLQLYIKAGTIPPVVLPCLKRR